VGLEKEKSVAVVVVGIIFLSSANAGVAQLVEHFLAKEDVARSNRVTRSIPQPSEALSISLLGRLPFFIRQKSKHRFFDFLAFGYTQRYTQNYPPNPASFLAKKAVS
jgi:hypothetical protein